MHEESWKAYLTFSKKDRNAAVVLLILIVLFFIIPFFYHPFEDSQAVTITTLDDELSKQHPAPTTVSEEQFAYTATEESEPNNKKINALFQFDPNTLDAAGFRQLGLNDKIIHTIINYRSKGGHFWKAEDIRKIYGLRQEEADKLIPYIKIAGAQTSFTKGQVNSYKRQPVAIDINTATAEQWKTLPGIGDVLANRIVKFRNKTGSFKTLEQVKQTYGLSDSLFRAIEPYLTITAPLQDSKAAALQNNQVPEKLNINTASLNQLKSNPHIPEAVAQAIIIYRSQHGNFSTIEDVKRIVFINAEIYNQIAPYLKVD